MASTWFGQAGPLHERTVIAAMQEPSLAWELTGRSRQARVAADLREAPGPYGLRLAKEGVVPVLGARRRNTSHSRGPPPSGTSRVCRMWLHRWLGDSLTHETRGVRVLDPGITTI